MSTSKTESELEFSIDCDSEIPAFRQLSDSIRRSIIDGRLELGTIIPSIRILSVNSGLSHSTVTRAFDDLVGQGYIVTSKGSGSRVCDVLPGNTAVQSLPTNDKPFENSPELSTFARRLTALAEESTAKAAHKLNDCGPATELTPVKQWRSLYRSFLRPDNYAGARETDPFGLPALREAYAAYLRRARAVRCTADQVAVFFARELRLDLLLRLLINPGDCVAVEDPCYADIRKRFAAHGANIIAIPVDHQGIDVELLFKEKNPIKFVYVTPSHNEPTGVVLTMARRQRLLQWARATGAFIIEDDYDSEYRYQSRPITSLQGMDDNDCVLHLSCLWKVLSPVVKLGFLVVPNCLKHVMTTAKRLTERDSPTIDQMVLAEFINQGHLDRLIRRNRLIYASRRQALVDSLIMHFGKEVITSTESAGMDMLIRLKSKKSDFEMEALALESNLSMTSSAPYYHLGGKRRGEFIIPFSIYDESTIKAAVRQFARRLAETP